MFGYRIITVIKQLEVFDLIIINIIKNKYDYSYIFYLQNIRSSWIFKNCNI